MSSMKFYLDAPPENVTDVVLTITNEATGKTSQTTPYSDGSARFSGLAAGSYRVRAKHPYLPFDLYDERVRVGPDRPAIVPIKIPKNIFEDTPIKAQVEAKLEPVRTKLDEVGEKAEKQAKKKGGQPIYADDWNELSLAVSDAAAATSDLTTRVSPLGHAHPELVAKLDEVQSNLEKFYEIFAKSLAELQRQIQTLALDKQVDDAIAEIPNLTPDKKNKLKDQVKELADATRDSPYVFTSRAKSTGQKIEELINEAATDPATRKKQAVDDLSKVASAMGRSLPVSTYDKEMQSHERFDNAGSKPGFTKLLGK